MWINTGRNLINLSLAKVIGISPSGGIRIDDFYIGMSLEDAAYFFDGLIRILKGNSSDYSVFDISEIMVVGGQDVE